MNQDTLQMLSGLLGNSDALKGVSDMLGINKEASKEESPEAIPQKTDVQVPDISFLANLLSNNEQSLQAMTKMKKAYDAFNNARDPSINLINALSPYLSAGRAVNANKLITAVKVSKAINVFRED